jgi:hypothetical protein
MPPSPANRCGRPEIRFNVVENAVAADETALQPRPEGPSHGQTACHVPRTSRTETVHALADQLFQPIAEE